MKQIPNEMVLVSGGSFLMGTDAKDAEAKDRHVNCVDVSDFYICQYPVTQKLWEKMMRSNPSRFEGDNRPVENVNWFDSIDFCNRYSIECGLAPCYSVCGDHVDLLNSGKGGFRLPTEKEWEFAARGGHECRGYVYAGSDDVDDVAWCDSDSDDGPHPIGEKCPNELGLFDMSGNVWEWCWDRAGDDYFCTSEDKKLIKHGEVYRIIRGGSWSEEPYRCRVSSRGCDAPDLKCDFIGLRVVLSL